MPLGGEVLECSDVVVGEDCGELVAPIKGQDGIERVELVAELRRSVSLKRHPMDLSGSFEAGIRRLVPCPDFQRACPLLLGIQA
jgi:hypothetical protein